MLEVKKEKVKKLKTELIGQKEINNRLLNIGKTLKSIVNIGLNYMEYISSLIYAMYENREDLKYMPEIKAETIKYIIENIDYEIQKIRVKEKSEKLFRNIRFIEIINENNYSIFVIIITELKNLIIELEERPDNGKSMLAEAFEYIIMKAAQDDEISFKNKEFYTPNEVVKTMVELLNIRENMAIYNPACGTGNFITESAKCGNIYAFGEETDMSNYNICITNLWLHNIYNKRIKIDSREKFQEVDVAIANPPFVDHSKEPLKADKKLEQVYYNYGISSTISGYVKHLVMMLESIHRYGKMAIILPHGFLFKRTNQEYWLRRELIKHNYIDAIIGLPEKLFCNTKIPVVILVINKAKIRDGILFIDASKEYTSKRKTNILTVESQNKIVDTYQRQKVIQNYSYIADLKEIEQNDYDLSLKKYIQIQNKKEEINQEKIERTLNNLERERSEIQYKIARLIRDLKMGN